MVGGDDADSLDPVFPRDLGPGHVGEIAIAADAQPGGAGRRPFRVRRQRPRDQLKPPVHARSDAVNGADKSTAAAADHAQTNRPHSPSALFMAARSTSLAAKSSKACGVTRMM